MDIDPSYEQEKSPAYSPFNHRENPSILNRALNFFNRALNLFKSENNIEPENDALSLKIAYLPAEGLWRHDDALPFITRFNQALDELHGDHQLLPSNITEMLQEYRSEMINVSEGLIRAAYLSDNEQSDGLMEKLESIVSQVEKFIKHEINFSREMIENSAKRIDDSFTSFYAILDVNKYINNKAVKNFQKALKKTDQEAHQLKEEIDHPDWQKWKEEGLNKYSLIKQYREIAERLESIELKLLSYQNSDIKRRMNNYRIDRQNANQGIKNYFQNNRDFDHESHYYFKNWAKKLDSQLHSQFLAWARVETKGDDSQEAYQSYQESLAHFRSLEQRARCWDKMKVKEIDITKLSIHADHQNIAKDLKITMNNFNKIVRLIGQYWHLLPFVDKNKIYNGSLINKRCEIIKAHDVLSKPQSQQKREKVINAINDVKMFIETEKDKLVAPLKEFIEFQQEYQFYYRRFQSDFSETIVKANRHYEEMSHTDENEKGKEYIELYKKFFKNSKKSERYINLLKKENIAQWVVEGTWWALIKQNSREVVQQTALLINMVFEENMPAPDNLDAQVVEYLLTQRTFDNSKDLYKKSFESLNHLEKQNDKVSQEYKKQLSLAYKEVLRCYPLYQGLFAITCLFYPPNYDSSPLPEPIQEVDNKIQSEESSMALQFALKQLETSTGAYHQAFLYFFRIVDFIESLTTPEPDKSQQTEEEKMKFSFDKIYQHLIEINEIYTNFTKTKNLTVDHTILKQFKKEHKNIIESFFSIRSSYRKNNELIDEDMINFERSYHNFKQLDETLRAQFKEQELKKQSHDQFEEQVREKQLREKQLHAQLEKLQISNALSEPPESTINESTSSSSNSQNQYDSGFSSRNPTNEIKPIE